MSLNLECYGDKYALNEMGILIFEPMNNICVITSEHKYREGFSHFLTRLLGLRFLRTLM